ncbi:hypothetical protein CANARDRAFT_21919 [[Candida] arabinofermentans NRRL YB-2248]|uniref:ribose-phosphate diphosphokinase n=1 Tax=[Candida] arabinofermentans NRRL YB-2248 TaxID=983967 RepID=A0A1E4T5B0_9ASCO|nr:hypothetical protein CANARDRAFT_21919 [[Candida] arabinofermentans NRRL YB-2248]
MRDIIVFSGSSNSALADRICNNLGLPKGKVELRKFANGETSVQFGDSVRDKDVYIVQSGSGHVNDNLIQLTIMISACKISSARRISVVCPLFFYSRQAESPSSKRGTPSLSGVNNPKNINLLDSVPPSPRSLSRNGSKPISSDPQPKELLNSLKSASNILSPSPSYRPTSSKLSQLPGLAHVQPRSLPTNNSGVTSSANYRSWIAQSGTLIANMLTSAGANQIITMDLHDPQFQGFFDIPVDNLYSKPLIQHYIVNYIPDYKDTVIVSPDAGGAKRATAIADALGLSFALIHKERRQKIVVDPNSSMPLSSDGITLNQNSSTPSINNPQPMKHSSSTTSINNGFPASGTVTPSSVPHLEKYVGTTMLVGDVQDKVCVLIDDLVDTSNTITRAAKLLKDQGCKYVYALITHGIFSGDAIKKLKNSAIDKIIVTNTVDQDAHVAEIGSDMMVILDVSRILSEAIRRINNGESVSMIYDHGW